MEEIARRARRLTIRLACMANRCFWLSAAEICVHMLTDGDCFQSHNNVTIFSIVEDTDVDILKVEACTHSTNSSDDYAHRGKKLWRMPFYVYRMYVHRIVRPGKAKLSSPTIFCFEPHYALGKS